MWSERLTSRLVSNEEMIVYVCNSVDSQQRQILYKAKLNINIARSM